MWLRTRTAPSFGATPLEYGVTFKACYLFFSGRYVYVHDAATGEGDLDEKAKTSALCDDHPVAWIRLRMYRAATSLLGSSDHTILGGSDHTILGVSASFRFPTARQETGQVDRGLDHAIEYAQTSGSKPHEGPIDGIRT
jgi:hypothetical protein